MTTPKPLFLEANKRLYAIGVDWGSRGQSPTLAAAAAERARMMNAQFVVLRDRPEQFGLIWPGPDAKPTLRHPWYAAAIAVSETLRKNTLAAWELSNGWFWVLAIGSEGGVISDEVLPTAEEAFAAFSRHLRETEYRTLLAPAAWAVDRAKPGNYIALLEKARGPKFQTPTATAIPRAVRLGAGAAIGLGIACAAMYFMTLKPAQKATQLVVPPAPVLQLIPGLAVAVSCLEQMERDTWLEHGVPLYSLVDAKCDGRTVAYTLKPIATGEAPKPLALIRNTYLPAATLQADGTMSLTLPLQVLAMGPPLHPTNSVDMVVSALRASGDRLLAIVGTPPNPTGKVPGADWQPVTWSFKTRAPAPLWGPVLAGPYTAINSIDRAYANGIYTWTIEGATYAAA